MRTSFISCARSSWLRRASALALALAPLAAAEAVPAERARGGDIEQAWFRLAQGLGQFSPEFVKERTDELLFAAGKADLKRLTPLALALVAQARTLSPPQAEVLLVQATRLDPARIRPQPPCCRPEMAWGWPGNTSTTWMPAARRSFPASIRRSISAGATTAPFRASSMGISAHAGPGRCRRRRPATTCSARCPTTACG